MLAGVDYVLRAQKFHSRLAQYSLLKRMEDEEVSERWIGKHRLTGEQFLIKRAPREPVNDPVRELTMN